MDADAPACRSPVAVRERRVPDAIVSARRLAPVLLALAAVAVGVGGIEHARLFHRGYAEVEAVGPLFLLNAIASLVAILLLVAGQTALFVLSTLFISLGSLGAILLSHSSSFLGFAESGYDGSARLTVIAEIAAVLLATAGAVLGSRRPVPAPA